MVNVNEFKAEIPGTFIGWLIDLVTRLFTNVGEVLAIIDLNRWN